ncbi:MAG: benzoate-CoA ligase family protein [Pseudomonadota bacterium]
MPGNGNAAQYFVDRHLDEGRGDKAAFVEGDRRLSYGELADQSDRMGDLFARVGLRQEDRAAMLVLDVIEFPVIFWGALKAGVVPVALNTLLTTDQYRYILGDSRARALFVSAPLLETVRPILEDLPHLEVIFIVGGSDPAGLDFSRELGASNRREMVEVDEDDVAFWLYSSGSTGQPKGVRHVHGALKATSDTYGAQVLGIRSDDVIFSAAKLFFAYGLGNGMTFPMSVGATTALLPTRPSPDAVFDIMRAIEPTIYCGVPTLYGAMLAALGDDPVPGSGRLRISISAGEALPAEIGQVWSNKTGTDILDGVGSTEMLHIFLSNAPDSLEYGTSGVAVPGYDLRLVDTEGSEVAPDEVGELLVKGASASDGYWNQRDKSRATFEGVWTRTGDKYTRRVDGRYIYCGRTDDMFKVSGQWVSPFEVEQALISHPTVLEAAVVPALDGDGLEKPKAFVVPMDAGAGIEVPVLQDHVKQAVGNWKYPRWIETCADLPKTATGKIQRFKLRE